MTKSEVLIFGMLLQADIFQDGHGTTENDNELLQNLLFKTYGVTEESFDAELVKADELMQEDKKKLVEEYRKKAMIFLENNRSITH